MITLVLSGQGGDFGFYSKLIGNSKDVSTWENARDTLIGKIRHKFNIKYSYVWYVPHTALTVVMFECEDHGWL